MTSILVKINRDLCIACMSCVALCPDVFEASEEDGKAQIVESYRAGSPSEGRVPEELEECVREAAESCPTQAILVEKEG